MIFFLREMSFFFGVHLWRKLVDIGVLFNVAKGCNEVARSIKMPAGCRRESGARAARKKLGGITVPPRETEEDGDPEGVNIKIKRDAGK